MRSRLLMSVSAAALIAGAGIATAQDKGPAAAPQNTSPAQQSATPPSQPGGGGMKGGSDVQQRQDGAPSRAQTDNDRGDKKQQRAQDRNERRDRQNAQDKSSPKPGATANDAKSERDGKSASDSKSDRDGKADRNKSARDGKSDRKDATTGQGAAGSGNASLTSEQRTKIKTNIRQTNVKRERNVNFNISVGTAIPRTVTLHALPPTVIEVYPQWRGYRFVWVEDEIIIIEPGTYRIVAVIDA